ncbi:protein FAR1-RELATED SEQUENCE 8-like [Helianthus annuus]|uniref:protein FAR1-RELATED SEQUENCE 8-like n=1 Tax=Helianthus annuus TaxID=4232 RepID=UPI000B8FABB5|nr:protein FAR1-RELATED SEQUENCE 8-like [Helianthus annuus]
MDVGVVDLVEDFEGGGDIPAEGVRAKGYLVVDNDSDFETEKPSDADMDLRSDEKDVNDNDVNDNDVMGKVFDTPNDAYDFYNRYAFLHGFGIRIHTAFKNKTTNEPYRRKYVCNKQGFKDLKCNSSTGDVKKRRRDLRTGCEAFIRISKSKDGKWFVD